jgi:hypothetical protein
MSLALINLLSPARCPTTLATARGPEALAPLLAAPAAPAAVAYSLRFGVHNGRTFIRGHPEGGDAGGGGSSTYAGGLRETARLEAQPSTGAVALGLPPAGEPKSFSRHQQGRGGGRSGRGLLDLGWVPQDSYIVVVLQLVAAPAPPPGQVRQADGRTGGNRLCSAPGGRRTAAKASWLRALWLVAMVLSACAHLMLVMPAYLSACTLTLVMCTLTITL